MSVCPCQYDISREASCESCREIDRLRAEVKDLRARLKAARELHWAISLVEREAFDALLRATDLRVKRWKP